MLSYSTKLGGPPGSSAVGTAVFICAVKQSFNVTSVQ